MGIFFDLMTRNISLTISLVMILLSVIIYANQYFRKNSTTAAKIFFSTAVAFYFLNDISFRMEGMLPKDDFSLEYVDAAASTGETAVIIHGFPFGVVREEFRDENGLYKYLVSLHRYKKIYAYRYFLGESLRIRGTRLNQYIEKEILAQDPDPKLAFYGFSLGGLIARTALQTSDRIAGFSRYLIMIGTPNNGVFNPFVRVLLRVIGAYPDAIEASRGSPFLKWINSEEGGIRKILPKSYVILSGYFKNSDRLVTISSGDVNETFPSFRIDELAPFLSPESGELLSHRQLPRKVAVNGVGKTVEIVLQKIDKKSHTN